MRGNRADCQRAGDQLAATLRGRASAGPPRVNRAEAAELTMREREIAVLATSGLSHREIARRFVVSVGTVDNHFQRVYRNLGVSRRGDLAWLVTNDKPITHAAKPGRPRSSRPHRLVDHRFVNEPSAT